MPGNTRIAALYLLIFHLRYDNNVNKRMHLVYRWPFRSVYRRFHRRLVALPILLDANELRCLGVVYDVTQT